MTRIVARCHPALRGVVPELVPARAGFPEWVRAMPSAVAADSLGGAEVRTVKQCVPFVDALSLGVLIPLVCDVTVTADEIAWDWDLPVLPDAAITRAPVGVHVPEQGTGVPFVPGTALVVKFTNFWTLEVPAGASLLFTHPLNREDLPFRTLSGVVDCDLFRDGYVHFPALLAPGFEGTIARGTPVAQVIAVPGRETDLSVGEMSDAGISANRAMQEALQAEAGVYRKRFRR